MLLLAFAFVMMAFLLLGAILFVVCAFIPRSRRYALSAALWFAVWGPCSIVLSSIAILGIFASTQLWKLDDAFRLKPLGWLYLTVSILLTAAVATAVAVLHQVLVKRLTFALFRLYAAAVSAGIGGVIGLAFGWWMVADNTMKHDGPPAALALITGSAMLLLVSSFGVAAYRNAGMLRGEAPASFSWITEEEYSGS